MTKDEIQKNSEHWYNKYKDAEKRIAELEAQIENDEVAYETLKLHDEEEIAMLKAQIEKMKNWCNCKNYQQCLIELAEARSKE